MKTARTSALVVLVTFGGLLIGTTVWAQNSNPTPQADNPTEAASDSATSDPSWMDNGLWDGATVGPGCALCGGGTPPDWYTLQGARIMSRSNSRRSMISFQRPQNGDYEWISNSSSTYQVVNLMTPTTGTASRSLNVIQTKELNLDVAPGYNATIGHYFCRDRNNNDHFVELTFWGLNSWSASRTVGGYLTPWYDESVEYSTVVLSPTTTDKTFGSLRTPFVTNTEMVDMTDAQHTIDYAFNYGLEHRVSYRTTMNNFEVNGRISPRGEPDRLVMQPDGRWRRECQPGTYMSYLYGIRYLRDNETFKLHTVSQYNATSSETIDGVGEYDTLTYNNLVGLQVGADVMFRQCRWAWGFTTKAGPFINFASQESTITATTSGDSNDTVYERFVANRYKAAFVGEMGVQATYKFRPNLVGRASYDLMWITGLALAPEQLQFAASPVAKINTNGLVFSQGVSLGLEWLW
ncbi:MAG: hypothetical protein LLF97_09940 [Planctomycetaceae bacterium]|nr:hypothetical protein [Planctomycetaceae bacterium]